MQDYARETVKNIVEKINDKYFLPDIQRDFVWKPIQVYTLFDSLLRDYPISTLLFWKLDGQYLDKNNIKKLKFVNRSNAKNELDTSINQEKEYYLVLDGQQRLTTFYLVLKGNYIIRNKQYDLYFNLFSGEDEDDGILYDFKFFNSDHGESFVERDKESESIEKVWIRVKNVYAIKDIFKMESNLKDKIEDKYNLKLSNKQKEAAQKLLYVLKNEQIIYFYPETEQDYDKVLDIFVRTNSGGTKLSYSDLLFSTIKSQWMDAREKFDELITNLNDNERYGFNNDFILKSILFMNATDVASLRYKTKNFKSEIVDLIRQEYYWKKLTNSIYLARDILKDRFFLTHKKLVSSNNAIIPIIYWLWKNNKKAIGSENNCVTDCDISQMRIWFVKALLSGVFGGQSDSVLHKCKVAIDECQHNHFPAKEIEEKIKKETKKLMDVTIEDIEKISYNSPNSHLVLSIVYKSTINFQPVLKANIPEQDHIFSQDELKDKYTEQEINTIFNIRSVGKAPNQSKSNKPFSERIKTQSEDDRKMHLIPDGDWDIDGYPKFIDERKNEIIKSFKYEILEGG
jgi:uncharacterized protein with ParB-like and HNH nuclease domain